MTYYLTLWVAAALPCMAIQALCDHKDGKFRWPNYVALAVLGPVCTGIVALSIARDYLPRRA